MQEKTRIFAAGTVRQCDALLFFDFLVWIPHTYYAPAPIRCLHNKYENPRPRSCKRIPEIQAVRAEPAQRLRIRRSAAAIDHRPADVRPSSSPSAVPRTDAPESLLSPRR